MKNRCKEDDRLENLQISLNEVLLILKGAGKGQKGLCERVQNIEDSHSKIIATFTGIGMAIGGFCTWLFGINK